MLMSRGNRDVILIHHLKFNLNIYFRQLILNIYCEKVIEQLDDIEDYFSPNFKTVYSNILGERLIGGIIKVYQNPFWSD